MGDCKTEEISLDTCHILITISYVRRYELISSRKSKDETLSVRNGETTFAFLRGATGRGGVPEKGI